MAAKKKKSHFHVAMIALTITAYSLIILFVNSYISLLVTI